MDNVINSNYSFFNFFNNLLQFIANFIICKTI